MTSKNIIFFTNYKNETYVGETQDVLHILDWGEVLFNLPNNNLVSKYNLIKLNPYTRSIFDFNDNILILDAYQEIFFCNYETITERFNYKWHIKPLFKNKQIEKLLLFKKLANEKNYYKKSIIINLGLSHSFFRVLFNPIFRYKIKNKIAFNLSWKKSYFSFYGNTNFFNYFTTYLNHKEIDLKKEEINQLKDVLKKYFITDQYYDQQDEMKTYQELDELLKFNHNIYEKNKLEFSLGKNLSKVKKTAKI